MRLSQHIDRQPAKRRKSKNSAKRTSGSLAAHRVFVPMLVIWGAALLGLSIIVLPADMINRIAVVSGLGSLGELARFAFAGIAAVLGGAFAFVVAGSIQTRARRGNVEGSIVSAVNARRVRPIDPASELGSESLDAPIERVPFVDEEDSESDTPEPSDAPKGKRQPTLGELSKRGYEMEAPEDKDSDTKGEWRFTHKQFQSALIETCEGATCEAAPTEPEAAPAADRPRELDLAEFAELPGRNAVWVEETTGDTAPKSAPKPAPRPAIPPATALEKLRQTPTEELSVVQMVERFAGALHEHQAAERARPSRNGQGRDVALAEALKALTLFTERGFDSSANGSDEAIGSELNATERDLRDALAKLQTLRGAA